MGEHIVDGQFQSDKYHWCRPGFVPLKLTDKGAQDLLWNYAEHRKKVDKEFGDDLQEALTSAGYHRFIEPRPPTEAELERIRTDTRTTQEKLNGIVRQFYMDNAKGSVMDEFFRKLMEIGDIEKTFVMTTHGKFHVRDGRPGVPNEAKE